MSTLAERILTLVREIPGLTDREITDRTVGKGAPQQQVNQACRSLQTRARLLRQRREDGRIGNYPTQGVELPPQDPQSGGSPTVDALSEDQVKRALKNWLEADGWSVHVAWGKDRGTDLQACRGKARWVIEAKGRGSRNPMRVNYFLCVLGELLQRMNDAAARYSIALPDLPQFRNLWTRLPELARSRTQISALFVSEDGTVSEAT